jgi:GT2 family glycosyltransferase
MVLRAPCNGGFASGNNFGLAAAVDGRTPWGVLRPDIVWLLNPDTEVRPGAVFEVLRFMGSHPAAGIVGTGIENVEGSPWPSAFHFPTIWSELEHALAFGPFTRAIGDRAILYPPGDRPRRVDWVSGASLLVRREVIRKLGFLDEGYFMYYEETDYCLSAARSGIECWQVPSSRVMHHIGKSSGEGGAADYVRRRPACWFTSRERYFRKNHGAAYLHLVNLLWCLLYPVGTLLRLLRGKPRQESPQLWWDLLRHGYLGGAR